MINAKIPNCMQLVFQLRCNRSLLNKIPNNFHFPTCTSFKALRIMKNEVAYRVCNLVFNIMYPSLKNVAYQRSCCTKHHLLTSIDGVKGMLYASATFVAGTGDAFLSKMFLILAERLGFLLGSGLGSKLSTRPS